MIKAKKSLGQNFLTDRNILEKITNIVPIKDKHILEVGPGTGNLTSFILKKAPRKLIVVEKDDDLALNLEEIFLNKLTVINRDILEIDEAKLSNNKITVFGNLPYNISTEILSKWITCVKNIFWFDHLILMFQKEVADRIIAKFNTSAYGRLPNTVILFLDSIASSISKISLLMTVNLFKNVSSRFNARSLSFSTTINFLGAFFKIKEVKFPVPGPTSRIFLSFIGTMLVIFSRISLSIRKF